MDRHAQPSSNRSPASNERAEPNPRGPPKYRFATRSEPTWLTFKALTSTTQLQEHILQYQVPVATAVLMSASSLADSIAANYRAEFEKGGKPAHSLAKRSAQVARLGTHLRDLARSLPTLPKATAATASNQSVPAH